MGQGDVQEPAELVFVPASLLGSNAVTCYDLDVRKLAPIAARIGPKKSLFVSEG